MNKEWLLCLACGVIAAASLLRMMRRRQLVLVSMLKEYVERQAQWNRRRAKANAIAEAEEVKKANKAAKAAALMLAETPADSPQ